MVSVVRHFGKLILASTMLGMSSLGLASSVGADTKGVIELYTSQGCSSCPPADKLAAEYAKDPNLLVLTLPVTYWDYLGWKDTFAKKEFTNRQYSYAALRGDRSVYTPQVVVNGSEHTVGSRKSAIDKLVKNDTLPVSVDLKASDNEIAVQLGASNSADEAVVWLVLFQQEGTVAIGRGENRNRTITYTNIVREMRPIGKWKGEEMTISLPKTDIMQDKMNGAAILVQTSHQGHPSKILGAASWLDKPSS